MRFTRKMKKALSVVMTSALVIAGVNFGMGKAEAADVDFTCCDAAVDGFNGDGTYTIVPKESQYGTWGGGTICNAGYFKSDQPYSLSNVSFTVNDTYVFDAFETETVEAESDGSDYKVDLKNCWNDYTANPIVYVSKDKKARIIGGSNTLFKLFVANDGGAFEDSDAATVGTDTKVTSFSLTFTYKFTGSTEDQPVIDEAMQAKGAYLEWAGSWKKENKGENTTTTRNLLSSRTTLDIDGQGGYAIDITRLDLSGATKPTLEVEFAANEDRLQVYPSITDTENPLTTTDTSGNYKVVLDASVTQIRITSYSNKLVVNSIAIYSDTEVYAKATLSSNVTKAEALTQADYTADSWATLQTALTAAKAVGADASLADINAANKALKDAMAGLKKATSDATPTPAPGTMAPSLPGGDATPTPAPGGDATPTPAPGGDATPTPAPGGDATPTPAPGGDATPTPAPGGDATPTPAPGGDTTPTPAPGGDATPTPAPGGNSTTTTVGLAKNAKATVGNFTYKVTKTSVKSAGKTTNGKVTVTAMSKKGKKAKKLTVPATIKTKGATYTVTAIGANAMKGSKATSVTLGKNVKSIAKNAFASCKKLSKLSIKAKLSSVAKGAFKGCKKTIKVSGTSKKQNLKKLKNSGYKKFK